MSTFATPAIGDLSRRIHGAERTMRQRAKSARAAARALPKDSPQAASLRGKAKGYDEAADLLLRLDRGDRLPPKSHRWMRLGSFRPAPTTTAEPEAAALAEGSDA